MLTPRHRGLGKEYTSFFRKDARSKPAANSEPAIAIKIETQGYFELETKTKNTRTPARERPLTSEAGALGNGLDLKPLKARKRDLIQRMWTKREKKRKTSREDVK